MMVYLLNIVLNFFNNKNFLFGVSIIILLYDVIKIFFLFLMLVMFVKSKFLVFDFDLYLFDLFCFVEIN